ncbi:MAG: Sec-independent protein translocase protein TatB [Cellvibrionaceae bacterium]|nr:Sec-independent protein translocase protein TatB [Cellvibrionaceae bacterium]
MFDIGFFELLLIAVVGLLVIGPERLPGTLRTIALYWGRIKRSITDTRSEIEQQIGADDIRRQLHNEEVMARLERAEQRLNEGLDTSLPGEPPAESDGDSSQPETETSTSKPPEQPQNP